MLGTPRRQGKGGEVTNTSITARRRSDDLFYSSLIWVSSVLDRSGLAWFASSSLRFGHT